MRGDFVLARQAFYGSVPGRLIAAVNRTTQSAWRSSAARLKFQSASERITAMTPTAIVRTIAATVMIAAALQPLLIAMMPVTVSPAMPWTAYALVAIFAAVVAWRADPIVAAWPASRLARLARRRAPSLTKP